MQENVPTTLRLVDLVVDSAVAVAHEEVVVAVEEEEVQEVAVVAEHLVVEMHAAVDRPGLLARERRSTIEHPRQPRLLRRT